MACRALILFSAHSERREILKYFYIYSPLLSLYVFAYYLHSSSESLHSNLMSHIISFYFQFWFLFSFLVPICFLLLWPSSYSRTVLSKIQKLSVFQHSENSCFTCLFLETVLAGVLRSVASAPRSWENPYHTEGGFWSPPMNTLKSSTE